MSDIDRYHAASAGEKVHKALSDLGKIGSVDPRQMSARELLSDALIDMHKAGIPLPSPLPRDPLAPRAPSTKRGANR